MTRTVKVYHHDTGDNYGNTFRVEDGIIKVRYDQYDSFNNQYGHLYFKQPYSYYKLKFEYRLTGEWRKDAPSYTIMNSGVMFHSQDPRGILKEQDWPISVEFQLLAGLPDGKQVSHVSADREADSSARRLGQAIAAGEYGEGGSLHAGDRRNRRPGAFGRRPQAGRGGDGRTALGQGECVARHGSAAGRRLAGGVRSAAAVGPRADARRRRGRILRARRGTRRSAARRDLRPGGCVRHPDRSSGSAKASSVSARRNGERSP